MKFIEYNKCSTCKKIKKELINKGLEFDVIDVKTGVITKEDIRKIHELCKLDIKRLFNTSGNVYKEMNLKETLNNYTYEQKLEMLASNGMLIKRPILLGDDFAYIAGDILKKELL